MASLIARRTFSTTIRRLADDGKQQLRQESKRNPEIYVRHIPRTEQLQDSAKGAV